MCVGHADKPLRWLHGELKTPPMSRNARLEAGVLLRRVQSGELLDLPASRPMPTIGKRCHELRIVDVDATWRVVYRIDGDAVLIVDIFAKKTQTTPKRVVERCGQRLGAYDRAMRS